MITPRYVLEIWTALGHLLNNARKLYNASPHTDMMQAFSPQNSDRLFLYSSGISPPKDVFERTIVPTIR